MTCWVFALDFELLERIAGAGKLPAPWNLQKHTQCPTNSLAVHHHGHHLQLMLICKLHDAEYFTHLEFELQASKTLLLQWMELQIVKFSGLAKL